MDLFERGGKFYLSNFDVMEDRGEAGLLFTRQHGHCALPEGEGDQGALLKRAAVFVLKLP